MKALQAEEFDLARDIRQYYRSVIPDFRRELEEYFLRFFLVSIDPKTDQAVWDGVSARRMGTVDYFTDRFKAMAEAAEAEVGPTLDEEMDTGFDEGYLTGAWMLAMAGVDLADAPRSFPGGYGATLAALAGFGGLSYRERLAQWTTVYTGKFERWLGAATGSGMSLPDTLLGVDGITNGLAGRVEALGGDELHRAFTLGAQQSWEPYRGLILGEMWLTREDELVCRLCQSYHKRMTEAQPIHNSHPRCRCVKVPIVLGQNWEPKDYRGFVGGFRGPGLETVVQPFPPA